MIAPIVQVDHPVTLVGGGEVRPGAVTEALDRAPSLVAVDSGARAALAEGHQPEAVIGDFDSLDPRTRALISPDRLFPIREQETTDFDKALRHIRAPLVLGVGFLGGRVDHQLSAFNTLVRHADRPCLLLGAHELAFHLPPEIALTLPVGSTVSLFPLAGVTGASEGLKWPLQDIPFAPDGRVGTSNQVTGPVRLRMDGPGMLALVSPAALAEVMRAFLEAGHARWPSRVG
ncbi:thiamine diphosphokinase [Cribrihabitans marinus]|uniref:Thiamine diphosphokinase n=1 Tax=Cribrihabitans marinus TaxID=1227549 RepID=A0A1H6T8M2_9RHOB|nr:thiamine diphosphokinase [Cribrihabitans marinus]GGH22187.1 thiamine pyrophosphokinase [Cribrihabitans marinus]SEI76341.1 thiamine diphosphokinase [Cribrihabitans marinus]